MDREGGGGQGLALGSVNDSGETFLSIKLINVRKINYTLNNLVIYQLYHFFCFITACPTNNEQKHVHILLVISSMNTRLSICFLPLTSQSYSGMDVGFLVGCANPLVGANPIFCQNSWKPHEIEKLITRENCHIQPLTSVTCSDGSRTLKRVPVYCLVNFSEMCIKMGKFRWHIC